MEITLGVEAWQQTPRVRVEELVERLLRHFPAMVIDPERGNAQVQAGLDELIALGAPPVILESHRAQFDDVVFVSISEHRWCGATASAYLQTIRPPLGDAVFFDVAGADSKAALNTIARELATALGMVLCSELAE